MLLYIINATNKLGLLYINIVQDKVVRSIVGGSDWCVMTYKVCWLVCVSMHVAHVHPRANASPHYHVYIFGVCILCGYLYPKFRTTVEIKKRVKFCCAVWHGRLII